MILTIVRREMLDHFMSARFSLSIGLATVLFVLNGALFSGEFEQRMALYRAQVLDTADWQRMHHGELATLGIRGPGWLAKRPSPLLFCASGRDELLPSSIGAQTSSLRSGSRWGVLIHGPWTLVYNAVSGPPMSSVASDFIEIDWAFIIGFVFSFIAILLTYDAIAGERAAGTLGLLMSQPVSRFSVLLGKFLAAMGILVVSLVIGIAFSLLTIGLTGTIALDEVLLGKVAIIVLASILYVSFFVAVGLLVSALTEQAGTCLAVLMLIWTTLIVLMPNVLIGVVHSLSDVELDWKGRQLAIDSLWEEHQLDSKENPAPGGAMPRDYVESFTSYISDRLAIEQRFQDAFLRENLDQVEFGRNLNRLSPHGVFQYVLESVAETGLPRHVRFVEAARKYERTFRSFIERRDSADQDSFHLFGIHQGMSENSVPLHAIPQFEENLSVSLSMKTVCELVGLFFFALAATVGATVVFVRGDV